MRAQPPVWWLFGSSALAVARACEQLTRVSRSRKTTVSPPVGIALPLVVPAPLRPGLKHSSGDNRPKSSWAPGVGASPLGSPGGTEVDHLPNKWLSAETAHAVEAGTALGK